MIILGLDTSTTACSVAVVDGERVLAARSEPMARGHQERLASLVQELMKQAGVEFDQLDRIGCTVGPGSFTGLRVGMAFAKAMALALDIPAVGVGTLEALAATVRAHPLHCPLAPAKAGAHADPDQFGGASPERACGLDPGFRWDERMGDLGEDEPVFAVAIDARREQVYLQAFRNGQSVVSAQALAAPAAADALSGFRQLYLAGSGAPLLAGRLPQAKMVATETPDPVVVARLTGAVEHPQPVQPMYLRAPDAKLPI